jgi:hypothetical protein
VGKRGVKPLVEGHQQGNVLQQAQVGMVDKQPQHYFSSSHSKVTGHTVLARNGRQSST